MLVSRHDIVSGSIFSIESFFPDHCHLRIFSSVTISPSAGRLDMAISPIENLCLRKSPASSQKRSRRVRIS
ncbi:hypothetical protein VTN96DRAFT_6589 [Rasamsonia emersonii]